MDPHRSNIERGAETAFLTAAAGMVALSLGGSLSRRRRAQGRSRRTAKLTCLALWAPQVIYWAVAVTDTDPAGGGTWFTVVAVLAVISIPVAVIAAYLLLLMLSVFDRATGRIATDRPGHWVTLEECGQKRAMCESSLRQIQASMTLDGLLAAGTGVGGLFGADMASAMMVRDQLQTVNQIEAHLRVGGTYWTWDD